MVSREAHFDKMPGIRRIGWSPQGVPRRSAAGRENVRDFETQKGRGMGETKTECYRDRQASLEPFQPGLCDDAITG